MTAFGTDQTHFLPKSSKKDIIEKHTLWILLNYTLLPTGGEVLFQLDL